MHRFYAAVAHRYEFIQFVSIAEYLYVAIGVAEHEFAHAPTQIFQFSRRETQTAQRLVGIDARRIVACADAFN